MTQQIVFRANLEFQVDIRLSETEARALDGLTGYGFYEFLKVFEEKLGSAYIRDHREGLQSFFVAVRRDVLPALADIDMARKAIVEKMKERSN